MRTDYQIERSQPTINPTTNIQPNQSNKWPIIENQINIKQNKIRNQVVKREPNPKIKPGHKQTQVTTLPRQIAAKSNNIIHKIFYVIHNLPNIWKTSEPIDSKFVNKLQRMTNQLIKHRRTKRIGQVCNQKL